MGQNQSILALGDSYTIGESVDENNRWPVQLYETLIQEGFSLDKPVIVATTGWTTDELLSALQNKTLQDHYDLVTLLIGVNNQYRGYTFGQFKREFKKLLNFAIQKAGARPSHVIVLSIPDWGAMPYAKDRDRKEIGMEIDKYNNYKSKISNMAKVHFVDITAISREAQSNKDLVADDGLHPSAEMYALWVNEIRPIAMEILSQ